MTAVRVLTSKWMLALGAVAILGLTAGQTLADPPQGGHYRPSPAWSHGGPGGYGHREMPFRGERFGGPGGYGHREMPFRGERFGGPGGYGHREMPYHGERFSGGHDRFRPLPPPPSPCGPRWSGGYVQPGYVRYITSGGMTITVIIR